ncbi:MAG: hypothetical protein ABL930_04705 [Pseudobdellovibrio sp.]
MKIIIILLTVLTFNFKAIATPTNFSNFELVKSELNSELFNFRNKIVRFSFDQTSARLIIMNNICPQRAGMISCRAMPITVVNNEYTLSLAHIDYCGVKTYVSNVVEQSQLIIRDNSQSLCEVLYPAQIEVALKIQSESLSYQSYLGFNQLIQVQIPAE